MQLLISVLIRSRKDTTLSKLLRDMALNHLVNQKPKSLLKIVARCNPIGSDEISLRYKTLIAPATMSTNFKKL